MRVPAAFAIASFTLVAGCNQILGIGDVHSGAVDAPPGAADAMIDAGPFDCPAAPANTVVGCGAITHVRLDGSTFKTWRDFSHALVSAYVPDQSAGGFHIVNGTGTADGTIRIDGVPDGTTYMLRLQDPMDPVFAFPHFFVTDKHQLELGFTEGGRDDSPVTAATPITLDATNLRAWRQSDGLRVESFATGLATFAIGAFSNVVTVGSTSASATPDWKTLTGFSPFLDVQEIGRQPQLIDTTSAHGDDLWLLHMAQGPAHQTGRPVYVQSIVDYAAPTPVTMTSGVAQTISSAFQPAPAPTGTQSASIMLAAFRGAIRDDGRTEYEDVSCQLSANPAADRGIPQGLIFSFDITPLPVDTALQVASLSYSSPYPAAWPKMLSCSVQHQRLTIVPGTKTRIVLPSYITWTGAATDSLTLMPPIKAPANIVVDGRPGLPGGAIPFDGTKPVTIAWDAVAGVDHYSVRIRSNVELLPAIIDTAQPSLTLPADLFTKGGFYAFRIGAVQTATDYPGGHLVDIASPMWIARVSTGLFRFSADCGNGVKDAGEECDPGAGGSTAACDADCSLPVCNDGFLNAAAGEQCDDGPDGDSLDCDLATCKSPVCGDGYWNSAAEECDDGNLTPGDGCSAQCTLDKCGDHVVQSPVESCDDGNRISGDGCSAYCQIESQ